MAQARVDMQRRLMPQAHQHHSFSPPAAPVFATVPAPGPAPAQFVSRFQELKDRGAIRRGFASTSARQRAVSPPSSGSSGVAAAFGQSVGANGVEGFGGRGQRGVSLPSVLNGRPAGRGPLANSMPPLHMDDEARHHDHDPSHSRRTPPSANPQPHLRSQLALTLSGHRQAGRAGTHTQNTHTATQPPLHPNHHANTHIAANTTGSFGSMPAVPRRASMSERLNRSPRDLPTRSPNSATVTNPRRASGGANVDAAQSGAASFSMAAPCIVMEHGSWGEVGYRPYMEDESAHRAVARNCHLFGVFDGHGGGAASKFCKERMFDNILRYFDFTNSNGAIALSKGFLQTEADWTVQSKMSMPPMRDGTTASVVLIHNDILYFAHAGDSRMAVFKEGAPATSALFVTEDHRPGLAREENRIYQAGGKVSRVGPVPRLWPGNIAVSRSIGDLHLKEDPSRCPLIPDAEVTTLKMMPHMRYVLIASDGLWDAMEAPDVAHYFRQHSHADCTALAKGLVQTAIQRGSRDNVTALVVRLNNPGRN